MSVLDDVDYGPLKALIGTWKGSEGEDIAPEPDGKEINPFYETICFEAAGDVKNAEEQVLSIVRYHQVVRRKSNDQIFHDQVGYWLWDAKADTVMQTVSIPRAVTLLAGGKATVGDSVKIKVEAEAGKEDWGIQQSPFMLEKAETTKYIHELEVSGDQLTYSQTTFLEIYGNKNFEHTDKNSLQRTGDG